MNASPETAARRRTVLVAEDNDEMRTLLCEAFARQGYAVESAGDGLELTTRLLERSEGGRPLDLLVTDVRMPWSSGLDVIDRLRRAGWATPVIVMTAFGDPRTHRRARDAGAALVLDKPFPVFDLLAAAARLVPSS